MYQPFHHAVYLIWWYIGILVGCYQWISKNEELEAAASSIDEPDGSVIHSQSQTSKDDKSAELAEEVLIVKWRMFTIYVM